MDRTLFDYLTGAGEVAATLGTGALAGFAGPAYGIYKGVTSPNYGTIEGGREADRAAMDLMSKMTYQPRGEVAQNLLGSLGQAMDAAKIPPVIPELMPVASLSMNTPASAAQFERAGMAVERAIEPAVMRTLDKGGANAQMLQDMVNGSRSQMFIGPTSKLWNPNMAMKAQQMLRKGATPEETWAETITGRMPGGFRQEIESASWKLKPEMSQQFGSKGYFTAYPSNAPLNTLYDAPGLFAAYPVLKDTTSTISHGRVVKPSDRGGAYALPKDLQKPGAMRVQESSNKTAKQTIVHEMQHAIDAIEGFPGGGSPSMFQGGEKLADIAQYYKSPFDAYEHLTSEALARLSASRSHLKGKYIPNSYPFKRATDPYRAFYGHGMDVDPDRLINLNELGLLNYIGGN